MSVLVLAKVQAAQPPVPMTREDIAAQLQAARSQLTVAPAAIPTEGRLRVAGQYSASMFQNAAIGAGFAKLVSPVVMDAIDEGYRYGLYGNNILNALVGLAALAGGTYGVRSVWNERAKKEEERKLHAQQAFEAQRTLADARVIFLEQLLGSTDVIAQKERRINDLGSEIRSRDGRISDLARTNADLERRIAAAEAKVKEFEELLENTRVTQAALEDLKRGLGQAQIQLQQLETQKAVAQSAALGLAEIRAKQASLIAQGAILEKAVALLNPELPDGSSEKRILIEGTRRLIAGLQACEQAANKVHCRMGDNVCFLNPADRKDLDQLESALTSLQGGNLLDQMAVVLTQIEGAATAAAAQTSFDVQVLQDQQLNLQTRGAASGVSGNDDAVPTAFLPGIGMRLRNSYGDFRPGTGVSRLQGQPLVMPGPQRALMPPSPLSVISGQAPAANSGAGADSVGPTVEEID